MAGDSPFRKKEVPAAVQTEIAARAANRITWNGLRFPWIKVTSMSSVCDPKFTILTSLEGGLYESTTGTSAYQRPLPVITGLDVKKQGELGTTRKATIKLTAFTDQQIVELQKCYFIPGMSVRVQWGWTVGATGTSVGHLNGVFTDTLANSTMKGFTKTNPNYEGLQGIVANFSYNLNRDNYWEATVEIIAAAEAFSKTKVNDYACEKCVGEQKKENGDESIQKRSSLYNYFYSLFDDFPKAVSVYNPLLSKIAAYDGKTTTHLQYKFNAVHRDENGGEDKHWTESLSMGLIQPDTTDAFISWSTLEAAVNAYSVPTAGDTYMFGRVTSKNIPLAFHKYATSGDPRVCILPGTFTDAGQFQTAVPVGGGAPTCLGDDGYGRPAIILDNIMLNATMVMIELKNIDRDGDGSLSSFLLNVLNKVNDACGNLWEFEVVSTSSDDDAGSEKYPTLTVIDSKMVPANRIAPTYLIPSTSTNSVLREMKLDLKLTDSMKTQALYANADGKQQANVTAGGGGCGDEKFKGFRLIPQGTVKNLAMAPRTDPPKCDECNKYNDKLKVPGIGELVTNLIEDVTDDTTSAVKSELIRLYALDATNPAADNHCQGMPVPFEFSCTMDGIGGFTFGQLINCDRVPQQIRDNFDFQVTSVEHSVTPNDWSTTINTVTRTKSK